MTKPTRFALLLLAVAVPAAALKSDRDQEILIDADRSAGTIDATELFGNVRIDQGSLKIRSDHAKIELVDGATQRVQFDGDPAMLEQALDDHEGLLKAQAKKIDYQVIDKKVVLTGNVVVERPRGIITGTRIVYDLDSGYIDAGEVGQRVHMRIKPKPKAATPAAAPGTTPPPPPAIAPEPGTDTEKH